MLSVVIPTLNAARTLGPCLAALGLRAGAGRTSPGFEVPAFEVIVADGGSRDRTLEIAIAAGARVIPCAAGRGAQLARGAEAARGDWLLFLHADTVLEPGWREAADSFIAGPGMAGPGNESRAAYFRFALDDDSSSARRIEALVDWRCRNLALPYGDQGLLIGRSFYERLGGFRDLPLMEDVDLVRRIGASKLVMLAARAVTSAERYRRGGFALRPLRNLACLALYFAGVPPRMIARLYG